ncbi:MAG: type II toxin-antitoxin system RelE/ParE family toxin [Chloroflexota bacterium]
MASYQIEIKPSASKELEKLPRQMVIRDVAAIRELADNPYPQGVKKLSGFDRAFRIRVGDYRVLYDIYENRLVIEIIRIRHRKDVYR